jgi:hypothetical protein
MRKWLGSIAPYRLYHGDACGGERAANPLHCLGIDPELFGNDAHTWPPRSRQGLTASFSSVGAIGGRPRRLPSLLARASPARTRSAIKDERLSSVAR